MHMAGAQELQRIKKDQIRQMLLLSKSKIWSHWKGNIILLLLLNNLWTSLS